jgi:hypothetical protein
LPAIADALAEELRPLKIQVLNVIPGGLRTQSIDHARFMQNTSVSLPTPNVLAGEVPEYAETRGKIRNYFEMTNGTQTGDPKKAASVIVDVVRGEGVAEGRAWDGTLFLGSDASRDVKAKCQDVLQNLEEWGDVARSIDV